MTFGHYNGIGPQNQRGRFFFPDHSENVLGGTGSCLRPLNSGRIKLSAAMASQIISFITPTFHRPHWLRKAIDSLLAQTDPRWEIVISPDDGQKYAHLTELDSRIRVVNTTAMRTGCSAAKNRGLEIARGDYIAALDDDDIVASNYVESAMAALKASSVVTTPTVYLSRTGHVIREIGCDHARIGISDFGRQLGSMPVICRRALALRWRGSFAGDVIHTCEAIDRAGGEIPVVTSTRYFCVVHPDSITATRRHIGEEYKKIINARFEGLTARSAGDMKELFRLRLKVNAAFESLRRSDLGYHEFVQSIEAEAL